MIHLPIAPESPPDRSLDELTIATPCEVPWDSLAGGDRVRHCGRCRQSVYNVRAFSQAEALELIQRHEHRVCLRLFRRVDGTIVTADCWSRLRAARRRGLLAFAATLVLIAGAQLWAMASGLHSLRRLWSSQPPAVNEVPTLAEPRMAPVPPVPPSPVESGEAGRVGAAPEAPAPEVKKAPRAKCRIKRLPPQREVETMGGILIE